MTVTAHEQIDNDNISIYYWVEVKCANCGYEKPVAILKGYQVYQVKCPKCECLTLKRKEENSKTD